MIFFHPHSDLPVYKNSIKSQIKPVEYSTLSLLPKSSLNNGIMRVLVDILSLHIYCVIKCHYDVVLQSLVSNWSVLVFSVTRTWIYGHCGHTREHINFIKIPRPEENYQQQWGPSYSQQFITEPHLGYILNKKSL